ncbi:MAG: hypothetical protein ACYTGQ_11815 [Planctomycetota bacterium]
MRRSPRTIRPIGFATLVVAWSVGLSLHAASVETTGPQPGEVYRVFAVHNGGNLDWRVTDPQSRADGAKKFLPNPILSLSVHDLKNAVRAELVLDRWGGHLKTTAKRVRFNGGGWITIPELTHTPRGERAEYFYSQDNPVVAVPLSSLKEGANTLEGTCSTIDGYGWGQWGLYSAILRVYYDPASKPYVKGRIKSPGTHGTIGDDPTITVQPDRPDQVDQIDVLGWYEGFDENGDGVFTDWHGGYFQPARGEAAELVGHVGTAAHSPWQINWDTHWVPDQATGSVRLIARIRSRAGYWYVTDQVKGLTLRREGVSVRMFHKNDLPQKFSVRVGREKACTIETPGIKSGAVREAVMALRTWHGFDKVHHPLDFNGHTLAIGGLNHHYDFDLIPLPLDTLEKKSQTLRIRSDTVHHMLEVLLPGPALLVRYER